MANATTNTTTNTTAYIAGRPVPALTVEQALAECSRPSDCCCDCRDGLGNHLPCLAHAWGTFHLVGKVRKWTDDRHRDYTERRNGERAETVFGLYTHDSGKLDGDGNPILDPVDYSGCLAVWPADAVAALAADNVWSAMGGTWWRCSHLAKPIRGEDVTFPIQAWPAVEKALLRQGWTQTGETTWQCECRYGSSAGIHVATATIRFVRLNSDEIEATTHVSAPSW